jgi:dipeptidyl aminopeptidase/acylaminoacyl peptidase
MPMTQHQTLDDRLGERPARRACPGKRWGRALLAACLGGACLLPAELTASAKRFELADLAKLTRVSDPQISPDGRTIVVVVSRPDYEDDRFTSELVAVDIATGTQRPLTFDRKGVAQPRWSPLGDHLAFLAKVGPEKKEKFEILVMPMAGGDARKITDTPEGVQQFAWRPGGSEIAYVTADDPPNKEAIEKHDDAFEVGNDDLFIQAAPTPSHLWLVAADGGKPRRLTTGPWGLPVSAPPGPPGSPLSWSPDGASIAFARQETPHTGDSDLVSVQILDVATSAIRALSGRKKLESFPAFSPDGSRIAFWLPRDADPNNVNEIGVAPASGGMGAILTRGIDRCLYRSLWMPDGRTLLVGGNDRNRTSLWLQPLEGAARRLDLGDVSPAWSFWVDVNAGKDGSIAFTGSEPRRPVELYYMASPGLPPKRLTDFNHEVAAMDLGNVETIAWDGPDGWNENGILIYPPGYEKGRAYPLVLVIHGGPQAASKEDFSPFPQLLAARGYLVFEPNYRGSDNLGNAYQRAIVNDAGEGPGRDVMAGLAAVKRRVLVDAERIAVSGWSYGGYMTSWLIGHYQIWKAAVAGAAVTDTMDEYNFSDFNVQEAYAFGGSPWAGRFEKAYRQQSPITYAGRIRTPTLILTNTGDARVPPTQSFKLYHALRDNGVTTKFVAYPVPGHFPDDPVRQRDVYRRWVEWMDQHLGGSSAEAAAAAARAETGRAAGVR